MIAHKEIKLIDKSGYSIDGELIMKVEQGKSLLTFRSEKLNSITETGTNFFECFTALRTQLEKHNLVALCQGSVKNVYPSQMALQMSKGLKAYRLKMGKQASLDDLVDIFDPASKNEVVSVSEQKAYFTEWVKSLAL